MGLMKKSHDNIVEYKEHMKGHIHFDEQLFPMSTISLTFFYVGF